MQGKRLDRVNQLVKEEISTLLQRELKDPRLGFVSVTEVETSKDLRTAKALAETFGLNFTLLDTLVDIFGDMITDFGTGHDVAGVLQEVERRSDVNSKTKKAAS